MRDASTRRAVLASAGVGLAAASAGCLSQLQSKASAAVDSAQQGLTAASTEHGKKKWVFNEAGYDSAEWLRRGIFQIQIADNPPFYDFVFAGPKPNRRIIKSDVVGGFGKAVKVHFSLPIHEGRYALSGYKSQGLGKKAALTKILSLDFHHRITTDAIIASEFKGRRTLAFDVRNTGTIPVKVEGVAVSQSRDGLPFGGDASEYVPVHGLESKAIPTQTLNLMTDVDPFPDAAWAQTKDKKTLPESFYMAILAHGEPNVFHVEKGTETRVKQPTTRN